MKNKNLKGFTLIELIVVMAIFSILMMGALALVDPVSRINKNASDFEKTYAYVDNIQDYLQSSLQYSEDLWVYQGVDGVDFNISDELNKFKDEYYKGIVNTKDGTHTDYTSGTIRVMTILNNDVMNGGAVAVDSSGEEMCKGQIVLNKFSFDSSPSSTVSAFDVLSGDLQLNPDFFNKDFSFEYIAGSSKFINSRGETAIVEDISKAHDMRKETFSIGIVTYDENEYNEVNQKFINRGEAPLYDGEYPFTCQYSVSSIPLINIINSKGCPKQYYTYGYLEDSSGNKVLDLLGNPQIDTSKVIGQEGMEAKTAFKNNIPEASSLDIGSNIYIIYTLSDEVNKPN